MKRWPVYEEDEIKAVEEVLRSGKVNYWTGEQGKLFEKEYAEYLGVSYAVAVANGTLALELCLHSLGIGPGDEVIVPCKSFIASASCVVEVGATPIFCDVDPITQNLTVETVEPHLTPNTKAIIAVHLGGWPCDMPVLMQFAKSNSLFVIEDCAQAHGARINGKPIGSFGHMAAFSFCQDKIITTMGEGGLVVTSDEVFWKKAWSYKDHGKNYDAVYRKEYPPGFRWLHESFGSNYRMTEAQAAMGRIQLRKLEANLMRREAHVETLDSYLKKTAVFQVSKPKNYIRHAYYRYYASVNCNKLKDGWSRDRIISEINDLGVPCFVGSCSEIYLESACQRHQLAPKERFLHAKQLSETSITLLVDPHYTQEQMHFFGEGVQKIANFASSLVEYI